MNKFYTLAIALSSTFTFAQTEILLNGNFENWDDNTSPTSWTKKEDVEKEATAENVHSGSFSAKHTGGTKKLAQTVAITPGATYQISIWYKSTGGDNTNARIWAYWKENSSNIPDNGAELRGPNGSYLPNNDGAWSQYTTEVIAPANATDLYFEMRTYSGSIVYYDDFSVIEMPTVGIKTYDLED